MKRLNRLFVVGAGFSAPAHLPLGDGLLREVIAAARTLDGGKWYDNIIIADIKRFQRYLDVTEAAGAARELTLEGLISFLDIEHHLRLSGSDTWTESGNRTQMVVKNLVAYVLQARIRQMTEADWSLYDDFVSRLMPGDTILTFNYDTLLERACQRQGVRYRLVRTVYERLGSSIVKTPDKDVRILKLHGSIDWFDYRPVREFRENLELEAGISREIEHAVFSSISQHYQREITFGTNNTGRLTEIFAVKDLDAYLNGARHWVTEAPLIVSPSASKIAYLEPLRGLWWGLGQGGVHRQCTVIGFSLPKHDQYLTQAMWAVLRGYQDQETWEGWSASPLRYVDRAADTALLRESYRFVDWSLAEAWLDGFSRDSLEFMFKPPADE